ncbi:hypothetical protein H5410_030646, partial [Solanum commersonii]
IPEKQNSIITNKDEFNWEERGEGSFKDVIHKNKWVALEHPNKKDSTAKEVIGDKDPLRRSLVSRFQGCEEIPLVTMSEVGLKILGNVSITFFIRKYHKYRVWTKFEGAELRIFQLLILTCHWPGRITIINSVLDSLPTYVMHVFPIRSRVEERLDKLEDTTIMSIVVNLEEKKQ